jgi:hypothetical protein
LDGNREKTVNLITGVRIARPEPLLSEDKTVPFDVELFQVNFVEGTYHFPPLSRPHTAFSPVASQDPEQWDRVQKKWQTPGLGTDAGMEATELWIKLGLSALGWDEDQVTSEEEGRVLTGNQPATLVESLDQYYLWAPAMSAA